MVDLLYIVVIIAFFALMVALVRWCEHIIGKDDVVDLAYEGIADTAPIAETTHTDPAPEEMKV